MYSIEQITILFLAALFPLVFRYVRGLLNLSRRAELVIASAFQVLFHSAALLSILWIVSPRVPGELKDGWFGLAGGLIGGSCFAGVMNALIFLRRNWKESGNGTV